MFARSINTFNNKFCIIPTLFNPKHHFCSTISQVNEQLNINGQHFDRDSWTNVTPRILNKLYKSLHTNKNHPLGIIMARISGYFYENFRKGTGTPVYSIYDNLSPIVTVKQNFDDLLIANDHVSRRQTDTYYINSGNLLRSHTSAHEADLIRSGLDAFLIVGDVYRRDEIDSTHYPAFHQVEGVRLYTKYELFGNLPEQERSFENYLLDTPSMRLQPNLRSPNKQERHGDLTSRLLEYKLKLTLEKLAATLFGKEQINYRWVSAYFPWTHPSFELEVEVSPNVWVEMLGCGIIEQDMLDRCGAHDRVGFAFGLGLERWAMKLFDIPDIRVFWSTDPGVTQQFHTNDDIFAPIKFKAISCYPPVILDISFWIPEPDIREYHDNDFYEIVSTVAGDLVERVENVEKFHNKKTNKTSHCYRIVYRHMSRNLTRKEINIIHHKIEQEVHTQLYCVIR